MIKKILQLVVVLLFAVQGVMAQSVEIEHVVTAPGEISVQVDMLGFTGGNGDVAAITLFIDFDADLMDFTSIDDTQLPGVWLANYNNLTERLIVTYNPSAFGEDMISTVKPSTSFLITKGASVRILFLTNHTVKSQIVV